MPTSYLDLEGLEYLWGKAGETFSPKNIDASSIAANGVGGKIVSDNNPLVIKDVAYPQNTKDIVVDLSPVQDFNGYSKPWVGGAGKNLLNYELQSKTVSGVTFSVENKAVKATGILSSNYTKFIDYNITDMLEDGATYTVSASHANLNLYLQVAADKAGGGVSYYATRDNSYTSFVVDKTTYTKYTIVVQTGTTSAWGSSSRTETEYFQFEKSATPTSFEPYSNICPIYPANGRNLLPLTIENLVESNQNQNVTWNDNSCVINGVTFTAQTDSNGNVTGILANGTATKEARISIIIPSNLSGDYYFTGCPLGGGSALYDVYPWDSTSGARTKKWDKSTTSLSDFGNYVQQINIVSGHTVSINCRVFVNVTVSNLLFKPMILSASANPTFIPYQSISVDRTGKNLLPLTVDGIKALNNVTWTNNSCTINGITFTINTDSSGNVIGVTANGTSNGSSNSVLWVTGLKSYDNDVILSGVPDESTQSTYYFGGTNIGRLTSSILKTAGSQFSLALCVMSGVTVSDIVFRPMIRLARSKNLLNPISSSSTVNISFVKNTDGSLTFTGNSNGTTQLPLIQTLTLKAGKYILGGITGGSAETYGLRVRDNSIPSSSIVDLFNGETTFELSQETTVDVLGRFYSTLTNVNVNMKPFICIPIESDDTFEPYQPTSITLPLGQDVYGGTYDIGKGELTITHAFVKMADQTIVRRSTNTTNIYRGSFRPTLPVKQSDNPYVISNILQSCTSYETFIAPRKEYSIGGDVSDNYINFFASDIQTIKEWQAFATENDVQICYELATPITIPLSSLPQSNVLSLLQGYNVISSSDGISGFEVTYDAIQESTVQAEIDELGEISRVQAANSKATDDAIEEVRNAIDDLRDDTAIVISSVSSESKIASFNDGVEGFPVRDLEIEFEPVQDLHGYNKPWVGGAGKNLLPFPYFDGSSKTSYGITYTVNADSSVVANGTATETSTFQFTDYSATALDFLQTGQYIITGCPDGGDASKYEIQIRTNNNWVDETGEGRTINYVNGSSTENYSNVLRIRIVKGTTVNNIVFKPMVRLATNTDDTFEPYENICPIYPANGRNLLENTATTQTINGVTFTVNSDDTITANGTATSNAQLVVGTVSLKGNTTYVINGCPSGGGSSLYFDGVNTSSTYDNGAGAIYTPTEDETRNIKMVVYSGTTVSNLVFKPMICLASEDSTFTPYQAIEVKRIGKNLLDVNTYSLIAYYNGTLNTNGITAKLNTDGTISISGTSTAIAYINLSFFNTLSNAQNITSLIGKTVIFSCEGIENVGNDTVFITIYKSDGTYYDSGFVINKTTPSQIYTFKNDAVGLRMFYKVPSGQTRNLIIKPMMYLASTEDNTYEPYTSTDLTLPLGQDIYGGRYNVMSGELVITHVLQTLNGSETWTLNNANSDNWYYNTNLGTSVVQNLTITKQYSNMYESTNVTNSNTDCGFWVIAAGDVRVREQTQKTIADWKTYLASNPLQVVYELATPLTYQLTPQQLTTLSKSNVIMTDSGYISNCEYYADAKTYVDERFVYVITNSQIDDIFDTLD